MLQEQFRNTYVTAPTLPQNFVRFEEQMVALRSALITDGDGEHIAPTALKGMGGIGKTILAQALCHDQVVSRPSPTG